MVAIAPISASDFLNTSSSDISFIDESPDSPDANRWSPSITHNSWGATFSFGSGTLGGTNVIIRVYVVRVTVGSGGGLGGAVFPEVFVDDISEWEPFLPPTVADTGLYTYTVPLSELSTSDLSRIKVRYILDADPADPSNHYFWRLDAIQLEADSFTPASEGETIDVLLLGGL